MPVDIEDAQHVIRHCKARLIERDDALGIRQLFPQAFKLRDEEGYLSASYYEYHHGTFEQRIAAVLQMLRYRFKPKKRDGLAMINAGEVRAAAKTKDRKLRILHEGTVGKEDYAVIRGIPKEFDAELSALLSSSAVRDIVIVEECEGWRPAPAVTTGS